MPEALPDGVELGKWYRRDVRIEWERSQAMSISYAGECVYLTEPELVPEEYLAS